MVARYLLSANGWQVVAVLPAGEAFAPLLEIRKRAFTVGMVSLVLAGLLMWAVMRQLLAPLERLHRTVRQLATRPAAIDDLPVGRVDEIGRMVPGQARRRQVRHGAERDGEGPTRQAQPAPGRAPPTGGHQQGQDGEHREPRQDRERGRRRERVAEAAAVDRGVDVERHALVLDLLGQVPLDQLGGGRVGVVEQVVVVAVGPPGDREGDRLRGGGEREGEAQAAVALEVAVGAVDPPLEAGHAGSALADAVVHAPVLGVVARLLGAERGRGGAQARFQLGQGPPHRPHEVGLGVGHQQRHAVDGEGQLGEPAVPGGVDLVEAEAGVAHLHPWFLGTESTLLERFAPPG